jgi:hypothetical protein
MNFWCFGVFLLLLCMNINGCWSYICAEGRCKCLSKGIIICSDVADESLLTFSERLQHDYLYVVVKDDMKCTDVQRLEKRTGLTVMNIDCDSNKEDDSKLFHKYSNEAQSTDDTFLDAKNIGTYFFYLFELILVLITLSISAKNRHNLAPFITNLPPLYRSNRTFIKNMFKVCKLILFLYLCYLSK